MTDPDLEFVAAHRVDVLGYDVRGLCPYCGLKISRCTCNAPAASDLIDEPAVPHPDGCDCGWCEPSPYRVVLDKGPLHDVRMPRPAAVLAFTPGVVVTTAVTTGLLPSNGALLAGIAWAALVTALTVRKQAQP